jgi:hypothetical protein
MAAAALALGCAWPLAATAADLNLPDGPIACADFQRGFNGSWTVLAPETGRIAEVIRPRNAGSRYLSIRSIGSMMCISQSTKRSPSFTFAFL